MLPQLVIPISDEEYQCVPLLPIRHKKRMSAHIALYQPLDLLLYHFIDWGLRPQTPVLNLPRLAALDEMTGRCDHTVTSRKEEMRLAVSGPILLQHEVAML